MASLKELTFFKKFPDSVLRKLETVSELVSFEEGEDVLVQGVDNSNIYFLVSGELDVYVDGGIVAMLSKPGDVVGEMGLISREKASATIKTKCRSALIKISGDELHRLTRKEDGAEVNLFEIYSNVLVQKLEATNHRAKHFETSAKELEIAQERLEATNASLEIKVQERTRKLAQSIEDLKQKNTELQTTHDKIAGLYQNRDVTFQSLENLLRHNLIPLQGRLNYFKQSQKMKDSEIDKLQREVIRAIHRLEPLAASFKSEKSMTSKKVLMAEPQKKQHSVARMALGGTGVELEIVQTEDEVREKLEGSQYDIFMFSEDFLDMTEYARAKNSQMKFVFVTSKDVPQYVPTLLGHTFFPNVVFRDEEDKQFTIKNFVTTVSKLASGNYFGLEKYISWGVSVKEHRISSSGERNDIIEKMDEYFANAGVRNSNRGRIATVADELMMNAIYDAPRDSANKPLHNHKSRVVEVELSEAQRPLFRYASDGVLMAVSVEDPFGALDARTLFRYLEKCYQGGSLNDGRSDKGGGGRGLHQIIENSDLVVFNIEPGSRTEVIALFNTDQKVASHRSPNLHFFQCE